MNHAHAWLARRARTLAFFVILLSSSLWPSMVDAQQHATRDASLLCGVLSHAAVQHASPIASVPRHSLSCGNIWIHADLAPMFEALLESSPTVRRQVAAIRRDARITVSIAPSERCVLFGAPCHALTEFARYADGGSIAQVRVRRDAEWSNAIGHELEHVCEWLEGVLRRVSMRRRDGQDETDRARRAGDVVHAEHARWTRTRGHAVACTTDPPVTTARTAG